MEEKMKSKIEWDRMIGQKLYNPAKVGDNSWEKVHKAQKRFNDSEFWEDTSALEELKKCFWKLANCYQEEFHTPADIKQAIIHLSLAVFGIYKAKASVELDLEVQNILQEITVAVSWNQLEAALKAFFGLFEFETEEEGGETSVLVKQAKKLIRKYYDQGITLEEIANKLYVSEEYLSAQFKKETGSTFTETIRKYRIEKVKELLLNTHLKLNQIAELAGYSDPKYMSKVFKEEVGMLPNDFRKSVH